MSIKESIKKGIRYKSIPGYEDKYLCSEYGDIYSLMSKRHLTPKIKTKGKNYKFKDIILSSPPTNLSKHGDNWQIHQLVGITWLGWPYGGRYYINHKDGNPINNHYKNLEWCNNKENMHHASVNDLLSNGTGKRMSRPFIRASRLIFNMDIGYDIKEFANRWLVDEASANNMIKQISYPDPPYYFDKVYIDRVNKCYNYTKGRHVSTTYKLNTPIRTRFLDQVPFMDYFSSLLSYLPFVSICKISSTPYSTLRKYGSCNINEIPVDILDKVCQLQEEILENPTKFVLRKNSRTVGGINVDKIYKSIKMKEPKQGTKEMLLKEKYPTLHLNLNQHSLADIFKVSRQTVNMWMNKETPRVPNYALVGMELINKKLMILLEEVKNEYKGKYQFPIRNTQNQKLTRERTNLKTNKTAT